MSAEHKSRFVVRFRLSLLLVLLHCAKSAPGKSKEELMDHVIESATQNAIHMSSRNDHRRRDRSWERSDRDRDRDRYKDRDRGGDRDRGRGDRYRDSRRKSRSRSPRRGDYDRRSGAHDSISFLGCKAYREQTETGETIVTTMGGTLIDETEMIVEEMTGGMTATAIGMTLGMGMCSKNPKLSLP